MKKNFAKRDRRGMVIYLSAVSMLLAVLSFLFPFVGEASAEGEVFYFDSLKVVFGGDVEILSKGYLYSYQFSFNLPFVVILFVALISMMAALAGRNSDRIHQPVDRRIVLNPWPRFLSSGHLWVPFLRYQCH